MRKALFLILGTLYSTFALAQSSIKAINIVHKINHGDRTTYNIFSSDIHDIENLENYRSRYKNSPFARKKIIKVKVLNYMEKYLAQHCAAKIPERQNGDDLFVIIIYKSKEKQSCYLNSKDESIVFFKGLKAWLNKYPDRNQVKEIVAEIDELL